MLRCVCCVDGNRRSRRPTLFRWVSNRCICDFVAAVGCSRRERTTENQRTHAGDGMTPASCSRCYAVATQSRLVEHRLDLEHDIQVCTSSYPNRCFACRRPRTCPFPLCVDVGRHTGGIREGRFGRHVGRDSTEGQAKLRELYFYP